MASKKKDPAGQGWFWEGRWQQMEREAQADVEAGRVSRFDDAEALIAELDRIESSSRSDSLGWVGSRRAGDGDAE